MYSFTSILKKIIIKQFFLLIALCDHVGRLEYKTLKKPFQLSKYGFKN